MKKTILAVVVSMIALAPTAGFAGDAGAGAGAYNSKGCVGCHGLSGKQPLPNNPVIGGKDAAFLSAELKKLRSGERKSPVMNAMAAALSDADIDNLAAYLSTQ